MDTADPAPGGAGHIPPPLIDSHGSGWCQPHPELNAIIELDDIQRVDLVRRLRDALPEAETNSEIPQILRSSHHHGVRAAVIGQRNTGFFWNEPPARPHPPAPPHLPLPFSPLFCPSLLT